VTHRFSANKRGLNLLELTQIRYGFSRRGADGKNQIGLSAEREASVLEEFWRHFQKWSGQLDVASSVMKPKKAYRYRELTTIAESAMG